MTSVYNTIKYFKSVFSHYKYCMTYKVRLVLRLKQNLAATELFDHSD